MFTPRWLSVGDLVKISAGTMFSTIYATTISIYWAVFR
jgi:hypothetical protein